MPIAPDKLRCEMIQPSTERWPGFKRCQNYGIGFVRPPGGYEKDDIWCCGDCIEKAVADGAEKVKTTK